MESRRTTASVSVAAALVAAASALAYDWQYAGMAGVGTTCIEADQAYGRILVGTHEGFWLLDLTSGQWTERDDEGWIGRQVWSIQADEADRDRLITGRENAFFKGYLELSEDGGASGDVVHMSQGGSFVDLAQGRDQFFACGISDITPGELVRSPDGTAPWTPLVGHGHAAMTAVEVGSFGEVIVAGDDQVWYTEDLGATWHDVGADLGAALVTCLVTYDGGGDVVTTDCLAGTAAGLWRSGYPFADWEPVLVGEACRRIAVAWAPAPWPRGRVNSVHVVTADGRVLAQDPASGEWRDETGSLPGPAVDLAFTDQGRDLYVCTQSGGVFRIHPVVTGADGPPARPATALRAWPNPFNPRVTLRYQVAAATTGRLAVYDLAGRLVAVLRAGDIAAGAHTFAWDATALASGVYLVRLETALGATRVPVTLVR